MVSKLSARGHTGTRAHASESGRARVLMVNALKNGRKQGAGRGKGGGGRAAWQHNEKFKPARACL
jgi:hypothetical protein